MHAYSPGGVIAGNGSQLGPPVVPAAVAASVVIQEVRQLGFLLRFLSPPQQLLRVRLARRWPGSL